MRTANTRLRALTVVALVVLGCRKHRATITRPKAAPSVQTVSAAGQRTCVVHDARVKCFGLLAPGAVRLEPVAIAGTEGAVAVADGGARGCAILGDRSVRCFEGEGAAVAIAGLRSVAQLAIGAAHACARLVDGRVSCWGANANGELGRGATVGAGPAPGRDERLAFVPGLGSVIDLATATEGAAVTCAARSDGALWCWGAGVGARPVKVALEGRARRVAVGPDQVCAVYDDGRVGCFAPSARRASVVAGVARARAVVVGATHRCALDEAGEIACWTAADPMRRTVAHDALEVSSSAGHACARTREGLLCWGDDTHGQLGDGASATAHALARPRRVAVTAATPRSLVLGDSLACVLGDEVRCWSSLPPRDGAPPLPTEPTIVPELADARALARGRDHACFFDAAGALACFGLARAGQLGTVSDQWAIDTPTRVAGLPPVVDVVVGDAHTCARTGGGQVWCFGSNAAGELAIGTTSLAVPVPTRSAALQGARAIALGAQHGCAILEGGAVACFGANNVGQLGDGRGGKGSSSVPRPTGIERAVELAVAGSRSCARLEDGEIRCWGQRFGGAADAHPAKGKTWFDAPIAVASGAISLAVGREHACAVRTGGEVVCLGSNEDGQCGHPMSGPLDAPRVVAGVPAARTVYAGERTSCARTVTGEVWCWGADVVASKSGVPERVSLHRAVPVLARL